MAGMKFDAKKFDSRDLAAIYHLKGVGTLETVF